MPENTKLDPIVGIYAGSFDPITRGHMGIICEAINKLDKLVIAVGVNPSKAQGFFSKEEREDLIKNAIEDFKCEIAVKHDATPAEKRALVRLNDGKCALVIESYEGMTIDFAIKHHAHQLIRGLRPIGDFETEQGLADANRRLAQARDVDVSTTFIPTPDSRYIFASSSVIRALSQEPVAISAYLYPSTADAIAKKVAVQSLMGGQGRD